MTIRRSAFAALLLAGAAPVALADTPPALSRSLPSANIFVGNSAGVATPTPLTGDIGISNAGAATVKAHNPAWNSVGSFYQNQIVVGSDGNEYRSVIPANVNHDPTAGDCGTYWMLRRVNNSRSVNIPGVCADFVTNAMPYAFSASFAPGAVLTFQFAHGSYTFTTPINLNNPFGYHYQIIGDPASYASVVFNFAGVTSPVPVVTFNRALFEVSWGHNFGLIDGITYRGPGATMTATANGSYYNSGFIAFIKGSTGQLGSHMDLDGGYFCAVSFEFSYYTAKDIPHCTHTGDGGFWAFMHSGMNVEGSFVSDYATDPTNSGNPFYSGSGFLIDNSSYAWLDGAHAGRMYHGVSLYNNSAAHWSGDAAYGGFIGGKDMSGASAPNVSNDIKYNNSDPLSSDGAPGGLYSANTVGCEFKAGTLGGGDVQSGVCNFPMALINNAPYDALVFLNFTNSATLGLNKAGFGAAPTLTANQTSLGINNASMLLMSTAFSGSTCLGPFGTISACGLFDGSFASYYNFKMYGATSGVATFHVPASFTSYEWDLPATPGIAGQVLTSQGGGGTAMTFTDTAGVCVRATPTVSAGFGTSPAVNATSAGGCAFSINVGASPGSTGTIAFSVAAAHFYTCSADDITTNAAGSTAAYRIVETSHADATHVSFTTQSNTAGAGTPAFADVIEFRCRDY